MKRAAKPKVAIGTPRVRKAAASKTPSVMVREQAGNEIGEEAIRLRAYQIYEAAGRRDGQALEHWLQAEQELREGTGKRL